MNYYTEIKELIINNEVTKKAKDYSKNKSDLTTYYNVGKLLKEAGKHYGEGIVKEYSNKLTSDLGKKYSVTSLKYMRQFYEFSKSHSLSDQLTYTHYKTLLPLNNENEIDYYIKITIRSNLTVRQLQEKVKNNEYERLPNDTKLKLINNEQPKVKDLIKSPIIIKNNSNYEIVSEKVLQKLILEDIPSFLKELGTGFTFIENEYKIKLGNTHNYIDLLLFNYEYNCFVVVELKITPLKKEHIGQIEIYMNYIDNHLKSINHDKTIGLIVCKKDNEYIIRYSTDERIIAKEYELV